MDERERDKFYSPPAPTEDDEEYELEPLDPTIVNAEKRHANHVAEQVRASIDIDEVYRDADRSRGTEILENWVRNFHYRFHIKHVLIATAIATIVIAVAKLGYLGLTITTLVVGSIAGLYLYLNWEDRKQQAEADAKREQLYAQRRRQMQSSGKVPPSAEPIAPLELTPPTSVSSPDEPADMWEVEPEPEPITFNFSLRTVMIAATVAAICLGVIHFFGGPGPTAIILGMIAFVGLIALVLGFVPPISLILSWWFILLLYVLLSIAGAVF
jgi:hypothetical protein